MKSKKLVEVWMNLLAEFDTCFTRPGRLKESVLRTFQLRLLTATLLRIVSQDLNSQQGDAWWPKPPWYPQKDHGSFRDVKDVLTRVIEDFLQVCPRVRSFQNSDQNLRIRYALTSGRHPLTLKGAA